MRLYIVLDFGQPYILVWQHVVFPGFEGYNTVKCCNFLNLPALSTHFNCCLYPHYWWLFTKNLTELLFCDSSNNHPCNITITVLVEVFGKKYCHMWFSCLVLLFITTVPLLRTYLLAPFTLVRLLPTMDTLVSLKVVALDKPHITHVTSKWLLS